MKPCLIVMICVCALIGELAEGMSSSSEAWRLYKRQHGKVYQAEEDAMRFANFLATKQLVERHNADPKATYKMALNHMADWTRGEHQRHDGSRMSKAQNLERNAPMSPRMSKRLDGPLPKEFDWRKVPNRVTTVKEQGDCDSGWAFATVGLLEGQLVVRNISKLISLSAQELIDCSRYNLGCDPLGSVNFALSDIARYLGGIESEADYPYEGQYNDCKKDKSKFIITVEGADKLPESDENELMRALVHYGPVAAFIYTNENFKYYASGVFDDPTCMHTLLNHNVLVVGYGTDAKGGDYWIVKNSWGTKWGEEGYMKIERGANRCGIAVEAVLANF